MARPGDRCRSTGGSGLIGTIGSSSPISVACSPSVSRAVGDYVWGVAGWLKKCGAVENSRRGVWALTEDGRRIESEADIKQRHKAAKAEMAAQRTRSELQGNGDGGGIGVDGDVARGSPDELDGEGEVRKDQLRRRLLEISPDGFERLAQRLLREAGFRDVEVLGESGDGGIDGVGVYRPSLG